MRKKQLYTTRTICGDGSSESYCPPDVIPKDAVVLEKGDNLHVFAVDCNGDSVLQDGTIVVEPMLNEAESSESVARRIIDMKGGDPGVLDIVKCTACGCKVHIFGPHIFVHPTLNVVTCKRCNKFYHRHKFSQGKDGKDEYCRWCADGGDLICCDSCPNAFCKRCIKRNLGRSALNKIESLDDNIDWKCFACRPKPIAKLQVQCTEVLGRVTTFNSVKQRRSKRAQDAWATRSANCPKSPTDTSQIPRDNPSTSSLPPVSKNSLPSIPLDPQEAAQTLAALMSQIPQPMLTTGNINALGQVLLSGLQASFVNNAPFGASDAVIVPLNEFNETFLPSVDPTNLATESTSHALHPRTTTAADVAASTVTKPPSKSLISDKPVSRPQQNEPPIVIDPNSPSISFSTSAFMSQIAAVNQENVPIALKSTRRCIETFSSDLRRLENKVLRKDLNTDMNRIVRSFQSIYRFHFARLANLSARMREDSVPIPISQTAPLIGRPRHSEHVTPDHTNTQSSMTIDLTEEIEEPCSVKVPECLRQSSTAPQGSPSLLVDDVQHTAVTDDPSCEPDAPVENEKSSTSDADVAANNDKEGLLNSECGGKCNFNKRKLSDDDMQPPPKRLHSDVQECSAMDDDLALRSTQNTFEKNNLSNHQGTSNSVSPVHHVRNMSSVSSTVENAHPVSLDYNSHQEQTKTVDCSSNITTSVIETDDEPLPLDEDDVEWKLDLLANLAKSGAADLDSSDHPNAIERPNTPVTVVSEDSVANVSIHESAVYLEDISSKLGNNSVINLDVASDLGILSPSFKNSQREHSNAYSSESDTSSTEAYNTDAELGRLETAVSSLERSCHTAIRSKKKTGTHPPSEAGRDRRADGSNRVHHRNKDKRTHSDDSWSFEEDGTDIDQDNVPLINKQSDPSAMSLGSALMERMGADYSMNRASREKLLDSSSEEADGIISDHSDVTSDRCGTKKSNKPSKSKGIPYHGVLRSLLAPVGSSPSYADSVLKKHQAKSLNENGNSTNDEGTVAAESNSDDDSATVRSMPKLDAESNRLSSKYSNYESELSSDSGPITRRRSSRVKNRVDSDAESFESTKKGQKNVAWSSEEDSSGDFLLRRQRRNGTFPTPRRRRVKVLSEDEKPIEIVDSDQEAESKGMRKLKTRKLLRKDRISLTTKTAEADERERRRRISDRQKLYNDCMVQEGSGIDVLTTKLVLDKSMADGSPLVEVHPEILKHLKPHQVEAVRFLWDCVIESVEVQQKAMIVSSQDSDVSINAGSGAVLAHCMGLGKTLSVIAFLHSVFSHQNLLSIRSGLIICPVNTLLNWKHEWNIWLPEDSPVDVFEVASKVENAHRLDVIRHWHNSGGVLLLGYDMFRNLTTAFLKRVRSKAKKDLITHSLLDPGPDVVVCDEGHLLKNDKSGLSKAVSQIRTRKRIILTGTPLQNNLNEYHAMINFVKPNLLGTVKEFNNRFGNPIRNGQHSNSTKLDVDFMKKRAHVLYKTLDGCVQRKDYTALTKYLPPRHEYIIMCRLTPVQCTFYRKFLQLKQNGIDITDVDDGSLPANNDSNRGRRTLFYDQQTLYRVWTHPHLLRSHEAREARRMLMMDDEDEDEEELELSEDESAASDASSASSSASDKSSAPKRTTRAARHAHQTRSRQRNPSTGSNSNDAVICEPTDDETIASSNRANDPWWYSDYQDEYEWRVDVGGKLDVFFNILKKCCDIGDKLIVFTQSLLSLDLLQRFLEELNRQWLVSQGEAPPEPEDDISSDLKHRADLSPYFSDIGLNTWVRGKDYERMDGSMNALTRKGVQNRFNHPENTRLRLFLISTRAGGLGINLVASNRLILFDACWNPSHDIQSIFRSYRFGQTKPVYIYRLIAQGTMEEKIYDRQVTKQSLSLRVVDEQQIDRHFSYADLQALYTFEPDIWDPAAADSRPTPKLPKDLLLADMLSEFPHLIVNYHEHDSLLEHREDEGLTEEQRQEAWREYEDEKTSGTSSYQMQRILQQIQIQKMQQHQQMQHQLQLLQQQQQQALRGLSHQQFHPFHPIRPMDIPPPAPIPLDPRAFFSQSNLGNVPPRMGNPQFPFPSSRPVPDSILSAINNPQYAKMYEQLRDRLIRDQPSLSGDPNRLSRLITSQLIDMFVKETDIAKEASNAASAAGIQPNNASVAPSISSHLNK